MRTKILIKCLSMADDSDFVLSNQEIALVDRQFMVVGDGTKTLEELQSVQTGNLVYTNGLYEHYICLRGKSAYDKFTLVITNTLSRDMTVKEVLSYIKSLGVSSTYATSNVAPIKTIGFFTPKRLVVRRW